MVLYIVDTGQDDVSQPESEGESSLRVVDYKSNNSSTRMNVPVVNDVLRQLSGSTVTKGITVTGSQSVLRKIQNSQIWHGFPACNVLCGYTARVMMDGEVVKESIVWFPWGQ